MQDKEALATTSTSTQMTHVLFLSGLIFLHLAGNVESRRAIRGMFVFGDSYADTGNHGHSAIAWQPPYGITYPRHPSGRHSDGRVLTDFVASFFNMSTPLPYNQRQGNPNLVHFGTNFASGGTGIFDTVPGLPNATAQIEQLQDLVKNGVYSATTLASSLVLFSFSGNDYGFYVQRKRTEAGLPGFVEMVIKQFRVDLERLYGMGLRQFAITNIGPLGCLPLYTAKSNYSSCNDTVNVLAVYHNSLLQEVVKVMRKSRANGSFVLLDYYSSALSIIQHKDQYGKLRNALKPCCMGACGMRDSAGKAMYSVCEQRGSAFFWDVVHPTQAAWQALMKPLTSSLHLFQT
ncbi:GDSL esterase/lipase At5g03610 [Cryptomeria japonica]|uniref:GDSL esterase/lipase At5g03610 n=1 Tax=Cryptomeria japonica TaxID=3369 RepID=UPI0027D9F275|nr:GDSL esterase/lipase At5g03610 [Cryptomeria japonica]